MKIFKKAKRGFTLVELVVVIAVIAILAAVSVGAYFGVTESANKSKLEQESKQFHTAIQTVALIGNENHTLNADGLRVNDIETFEDAIEKQMGQDVEVLADVNPAEINKQTIVLNNTAVKEQNNGTLYKTFDYYTHEVSGKKIAVDTVTGEFKHYGNLNFKIDTEDTTEAEFFTVYFENNWSWPDPKVYFWGSEKVECEAFPGKELTNVVGHNDQNYDIYEVIIPIDADGFKFSGTGGYGSDESTDILVDDTNKAGNICYYMTYDNATSTKPCGSYEYDPNAVPEVPDTPDTPVDRASDYHIKGTVNGTNWDSEIIMNPVENTEDQFTITLTDCAVDSVFKVFSIENSNGWGFANVEQTDIYLGANGDYGDIEILVAGTYEVVFNSTTEKITYTYSGEGQPVTYEKTRVYFDNPENWEEVRVHYWGGQFGTTWPGNVMEKDGDYFTIEVESACTGLQFNNGQSGENEKKTADLTLDPTKPYYVNGEWVADPNATPEPDPTPDPDPTPEPEGTLTITSTSASMNINELGNLISITDSRTEGTHSYTYEVTESKDILDVDANGKITAKANGTATIKVKDASNDSIESNEITITVSNNYRLYFMNDWKWSKVYAHIWEAGSLNTDWSNGTELTNKLGQYNSPNDNAKKDVYFIDLPMGAKVLFKDAKGNPSQSKNQTEDLTSFEVGKFYYIHWKTDSSKNPIKSATLASIGL